MGIKKRKASYEVRIKRKQALQSIGIRSGTYTFTVTTHEQAESELTRIYAEIDQGIIPAEIMAYARVQQRQNDTTTIGQVWQTMQIDPNTETSPATTRLINGLLDSMGDIVINDFTAANMLNWLESLKQSHNAPGTIRKKVGAIRAIFRYAALSESLDIHHNVFDKLPKNYAQHRGAKDKRNTQVKRDVQRERRLNPGEYALICKAIAEFRVDPRRNAIKQAFRPAIRLLFEVAINTGMRLQEIILMKWADLDFTQRGIITIPAINTKVNKERFVPMTTTIKRQLEDYRAEFASDGTVLPFINEYSGHIRNCSTGLSHTWTRLMKNAQIVDLRFHDLRHEAISRFAERSSLSIIQLMNITGHGDMRTFQRYVNLRATEIGQAY